MEYGAIDLHKKESQIRILTEDGEIVDRRIATTRERVTAVFWGRPRMRILLEAAAARLRGPAAYAHSARGADGDGVGGATPGNARPRGDRGRSKFHGDVWPPQPAH